MKSQSANVVKDQTHSFQACMYVLLKLHQCGSFSFLFFLSKQILTSMQIQNSGMSSSGRYITSLFPSVLKFYEIISLVQALKQSGVESSKSFKLGFLQVQGFPGFNSFEMYFLEGLLQTHLEQCFVIIYRRAINSHGNVFDKFCTPKKLDVV